MTHHDLYISYFENRQNDHPLRGAVENLKPQEYFDVYRLFCFDMANLYDKFYKITRADRAKNKIEITEALAKCIKTATELAIIGGLNVIDIDIHLEYTNKYYIERNLFNQDNKIIANNLFMSTYNFGISCKLVDQIEKFQKQLHYSYNFFLNSACQFDISIEELSNAIQK